MKTLIPVPWGSKYRYFVSVTGFQDEAKNIFPLQMFVKRVCCADADHQFCLRNKPALCRLSGVLQIRFVFLRFRKYIQNVYFVY